MGGPGELESGQAALRLFVAIRIPVAWRDYLSAAAKELAAASPGYARWVRPELLHLTLVFLGYQRPELREVILSACREAAPRVGPFPLEMGAAGSFGPPSRPRVIWVDVVDPDKALPALHTALVDALTARGVRFDARPLVPHITLGRAQRDATARAGRGLSAALLPTAPAQARPEPFTVKAISLMRSELFREGPRYTEQERVSLT